MPEDEMVLSEKRRMVLPKSRIEAIEVLQLACNELTSGEAHDIEAEILLLELERRGYSILKFPDE